MSKRKRIRAHANPLSDNDLDWPLSPDHFDWSAHYPAYINKDGSATALAESKLDLSNSSLVTVRQHGEEEKEVVRAEVKFADIGCGFGGMTIALGQLFPNKLSVGMEIRDRVVEIVKDRIDANRVAPAKENDLTIPPADYTFGATNIPSAPSATPPTDYQNVACIRVNIMKYAANYFRKGQLEKVFFLFPDPHFKKANFRRRVINQNFLAIYAYILKVGGILYTISDVYDLHVWMATHCASHPLFERIPDEELANDPCFRAMHYATEEGQKVSRLSGKKFPAVFRRIAAKDEE